VVHICVREDGRTVIVLRIRSRDRPRPKGDIAPMMREPWCCPGCQLACREAPCLPCRQSSRSLPPRRPRAALSVEQFHPGAGAESDHTAHRPILLAVGRGTVIVLPFALPRLRGQWGLVRRHWVVLSLLAVLGGTNFNTFVYVGLQTTTATNAVLLVSTTPVLIVLLSFLLLRQRVSPRQAAGIVLSLAGVAVIIARGSPSGGYQWLRIR